jgi:tetrahydromethanopterin S-methyltransferase subunit G
MVDTDLVVIFGGIFLTTVGYQVSRAVARRLEHRAPPSDELAAIRMRLDEIGQTVDSIAIEVERVAEAQRFSAKLLAERTDRPGGQA